MPRSPIRDVAAVFCLRGGWGSARLLDRVDTALLRANPKPLVGFSDITALHALLAREGLVGFARADAGLQPGPGGR